MQELISSSVSPAGSSPALPSDPPMLFCFVKGKRVPYFYFSGVAAGFTRRDRRVFFNVAGVVEINQQLAVDFLSRIGKSLRSADQSIVFTALIDGSVCFVKI